MAGCMKWYDLSMFGQVGGRKESVGKKNKFKNLLLPLLHVQRKKKRKNAVQNIIVSGFFVFLVFSPFFVWGPKNG
jgi:hypothetical protein